MKHKQFGFGHLGLLLIVVVLVVVGLAGWQVFKKQGGVSHILGGQSNANWNSPMIGEINEAYNMPACQGTNLFSSPVADLSTFDHIEPLGNTSSYNGNSQHVFPVDHMYFYFHHTGDQFSSPTLPATVLSPGNLEVFQIKSVAYIKNGAEIGHDYTVFGAPCKEVTVYLGHINTISTTLQNAVTSATGTKKYCQPDNVMDGTTFRSCTYAVLLNVKAGDQIGTAGGPGVTTQAFDFGTYDMRKTLAFIDTKYWTPENTHAVCGLNYYASGSVKTAQFQKVNNTKLTDGLPDCGTNMWDKAGTVQGNWVLPNTPKGAVPDAQGLSIAPYNSDPNKVDVDWGGTIAPANKILATMASNGVLNRNPAQVSDSKVYCYADGYNHVDVQLVNSSTLKADSGSSGCASTPTLTNPTTYNR